MGELKSFILTKNTILFFAMLICLLSVILGAFGAHALKTVLSSSSLDIFKLGNYYQFNHGVALSVVGILLDSYNREETKKLLNFSAITFILGIVLSSGSLYLLALGFPKQIGFITPLGGMCFVAGWLALVVAFWKER